MVGRPDVAEIFFVVELLINKWHTYQCAAPHLTSISLLPHLHLLFPSLSLPFFLFSLIPTLHILSLSPSLPLSHLSPFSHPLRHPLFYLFLLPFSSLFLLTSPSSLSLLSHPLYPSPSLSISTHSFGLYKRYKKFSFFLSHREFLLVRPGLIKTNGLVRPLRKQKSGAE